MTELSLIHWTIRLALAAFLACLLGWATRSLWASRWPGRALWTTGLALFGLHLLAAFAFYHHWSHSHAVQHTAAETEKLMGFRFGEGIYFSYFFGLLWLADVAWWWLAPASYMRRPNWLGGLIVGYLVFIAFHGAIVFEGGVTRYAGAAGCVVLLSLMARSWQAGPQPANSTDALNNSAASSAEASSL